MMIGSKKKPPTVQERITDYLISGGLLNPELANHEAVRDLLIEADKVLNAREAELARVYALPDLEFIKARAAILQRLAAISRITDNEAIRDITKAIVADLDKASIYVKRLERAANTTAKGSSVSSGTPTD